jgi:hypothetical protein
MGRNTDIHGFPGYREVLVANAVRALRDTLPPRPRFTAFAERRAWLATRFADGSWRAVAVAAGAIPDSAILR